MKWLHKFPFTNPRKEQVQSIDFVLDTFNKGKKYCILECPVGVGKSAIAITISQYLLEQKKYRSYILTTQKILQEQYVKDFPTLANIMSRGNYQCVNKGIGITCDIGSKMEMIMGNKSYPNRCVYTSYRERYKNSDISLTNMSYFLSANDDPRDLLIVDECHNIENIVTDHVAFGITRYFVEEILHSKWLPFHVMKNEQIMEWIEKTYFPLLGTRSEELNNKIQNGKNSSFLESKHGITLLKRAKDFEKKLEDITVFLKNYNVNSWVITASQSEDSVVIKPLYADLYTNKLLFSKASRVLLMSGTILNKESFCRNIGIKAEETEFLSLPSPFPIQNRPVYEICTGSMGSKSIDSTLPAIVESIKMILEHHSDVKGIIHTSSFKIAKYISDNVKSDRLLMHNSSDRIDMLKYHLSTDKPTVLISPSFTEGIDLVDDASRFQIIAKIPFPFLGDKYIKTKMEKVKGWYEWQTIKTVIQSTGRSIRSETDHAVTYILDSDWKFLKQRNLHLLPKWFKDSLQ